MGATVTVGYGLNLLPRYGVSYGIALALDGSGRHEDGVSRLRLEHPLCYHRRQPREAFREILDRGKGIGETAWNLELSRLQ